MENMEALRQQHPLLFTIDVEDYFHIIGVSGTPPVSTWDSLPGRVEHGLRALFELLGRHHAKATLFFLGYMAKRYPHLVREANALGHEIASHGMSHEEVNTLGRERFLQDAEGSRKLLEDICSREVWGWRSAGFSVDEGTPWFFDTLLKAGYFYDSSLVPTRRDHRELFGAEAFPAMLGSGIYEFPVGVADVLGNKLNMFGGGYLRFFPAPLVEQMARRTLARRPLVVYIHPREMDSGHPRVRMNLYRRFKSYVNMDSVPGKLERLLNLARCETLGSFYEASKAI